MGMEKMGGFGNMNRREFITKAVAAGVGGLTYEAIDTTKKEKKEGDVAQEIKKDIEGFKEVFREHTAFKMLAEKEVINGDGCSRHEYLKNYFQNNKSKYIPPEVRAYIANLLPGIAAEETKFNNGLKSSVGAFGLLQIMPSTYYDTEGHKDETKLNETKNSLVKQTAFCFKYLDEKVYKHLTESESAVPLNDICTQFQLDKKEGDIFKALVTVNSYNAGQGNMAKILKKFTEMYPAVDDLPQNYNGSGLGLFYILANTAKEKKFASGYKTHARDYVLKVLAGIEVLNENLGTSYGLEIEPKDKAEEKEKPKSTLQSTIEAGAVGVGVGAVASVVHEKLKKKDIWARKTSISRKEFVSRTAKVAAVLAAAGITGSKIPNMVSKVNSGIEGMQEDSIEGLTFPDGSIYNQQHVSDKLKKFQEVAGETLFPNENFGGDIDKTNEETKNKLPKRNYVSSGFKSWFKKNGDEGKITRYISEGQIVNAVEGGELTSIEEVNDLWRCFNVKGGHEYKGFNHPSYLALHPKAFAVLQDIALKFQQKITDAGIDKSKWKIRPRIESLIRDKKMSNGSDYSAHEFGLAIDFPKKKAFDLIYTPDNTFMILDKKENKLLYKAVETLFMETLIDIDKDEKVLTTSESHPPHFHIATKN